MTLLPVAAYAEETGSTAEVMLNEADDLTDSGAEGQTSEIATEEEPQGIQREDETWEEPNEEETWEEPAMNEEPEESEESEESKEPKEPGEILNETSQPQLGESLEETDQDGEMAGGSYILPVFETSDTHGHLADVSATPYKYLLAFISDKVKDVRGYGEGARDDLAILLDGGDIYQGYTLSNLMRGQPIAAAYQIMGYDAVTIGNHDFDWGLETAVDADKTMMDYEIDGIAGENRVPVVSANIYRNGAKIELADDYIILHKTAVDEEGNEIPVKVAVIGYADRYGNSIKYEQFDGAGYSISLDYDKVNAIAVSLEESGQCDATILLAHEDASRIAERIGEDTVIDLVLGGHTHYNSNAATEWNLRYMQPAANGGAYVQANMAFRVEDGRPVFEKVQSGRIINVNADPSKLTNDPQNAEELDPELVDLTDRVVEQLRDILDNEVGYITESVLRRTYIEESGQRATTAGNWVTSIYRRVAGADVAFMNGGGLRAEFVVPEGQDRLVITLSDIYTMFPFDNLIYCYEITYEELLKVLQYALTDQGKILLSQMSGIDCYYTGTTVNAIVVGGGGSGAGSSVGGSGGESSDDETIYANGKWKEGWKDKKLCVAMNEYMATTNRVTSEGQANPFYEWRGTEKLLRFDQTEDEGATAVLTAEAEANDGYLFIDTAPHFIEKEHEDIPEDEEPGEDEPGEDEPGEDGPEPDDHEPGKDDPEPDKPGSDEPSDPEKPGQEEPVKPGKPSGQGTEKTETTEASSDGASTTAPKVGDTAETGLWLALMTLSVLGVGLRLVLRQRD